MVPGEPYVLHSEGHKVLTFAAKHPDVGALVVYDEWDELTVCIGELSHRHFGNDEPEDVAMQAARFIRAVLNDEVEFFGNSPGGGGCHGDRKPQGLLSRLLWGRPSFVWSGPIERSRSARQASRRK